MKTKSKPKVLGGKLKCSKCGMTINGSLSSVERHNREFHNDKKQKR